MTDDSDALRTKETLKIMQQQVPDFLDAEVHFISSFYSIAAMDGQTADHLQQAICNYSRDDILTVMCMGHNKGWEEAASMFSGASIEINTCNAALLEAAGKSWAEAFASAGLGGWKLQDIFEKTISSPDPRNLLQFREKMESNDVSLEMADYNPDQYLWENDFTLAGKAYKRRDLEATYQCKGSYLAMQPLPAFTFP
ncbi:hypothetical protein NC653_018139 [Populus alba x Populus x berolinensis]|uniref:Uncharacterized protein n=1 Tax=Populus alba x Populus x berolinensis TaxID=444605 RepID=A0AAD6W1V2_9ROSI|nr:hypothetical protein NC653_018139 [Populus alba x Populus x berolinensis]